HTYPLSEYMRHVDGRHWEGTGRLLLSSARKLATAGAQLLICPDNTLHQALDLVRVDSPAPWLHIAEEVAAFAADQGFKRVVVLGCTEIPLLISDSDSPLPILDSTRILARAALREATRDATTL